MVCFAINAYYYVRKGKEGGEEGGRTLTTINAATIPTSPTVCNVA